MHVLEAPETASCAVWVAQPARSLHRRRPPMAASERDSSRPYVTNVPSVPGNRDYFTTFSQANVKYDLCIWLPPPAVPTRYARSTASPCHEPKMSHPDLVRCTMITMVSARDFNTFSSKRMICAFGCHHRPSLQDAPDQRDRRVMSQRCLTRT
jgi:hypothetical protein